MNPPSSDSPELTAYALGELSGAQAPDVHDLLANCPAASFELEQVEAVTEALRQGAPIPQQRLNPEQRHAVLYPSASHLQRRHAPALVHAPGLRPAAAKRRAPSSAWPALTAFAKAAAVITVAAIAFTLGRKTSGPQSAQPVQDVVSTKPANLHAVVEEKLPFPVITPRTEIVNPTPSAAEIQSGAETVTAAETVEKKDVAVLSPSEEMPVPADIAQVPQPAEPAKTLVATTDSNRSLGAIAGNAQGKNGQTAAKPAAPVSIAAIGITPSPRSESFINAIRKPNDQSELKPFRIRPQPVKDAKTGAPVFASPMKGNAGNATKDNNNNNNTRNRPADLFIHSWRADVMTCPWNETNRLLRVVIQLPADQPAVLNGEHGYGLNIAFEPNYVREYRILCERNQPATELRSAGTHVIWYEFQPNGPAESVHGNGKPIATVTLPGSRFTTPAVDLFDGSKLRVLDRGIAWQNAREDFAFESAVVGFGMLLRGTPETAKLNHQLVLNLATRFKGKDSTGERARFIRLVQEAKQAAGL